MSFIEVLVLIALGFVTGLVFMPIAQWFSAKDAEVPDDGKQKTGHVDELVSKVVDYVRLTMQDDLRTNECLKINLAEAQNQLSKLRQQCKDQDGELESKEIELDLLQIKSKETEKALGREKENVKHWNTMFDKEVLEHDKTKRLVLQNSFTTYTKEAIKTALYQPEDAGVYPLFALAGEVGEALNVVKKVMRAQGSTGLVAKLTPEVRAKLHEELGDVLWYLAVAANDFGMPLGEIAKANIEKLRNRHLANAGTGPKTPNG